MKKTWAYNALALIAVALIASSATIALAEETGTNPPPRTSVIRAYFDNVRNNQKPNPATNPANQIRPANGQPNRPLMNGENNAGTPPLRASTTPIRERMDARNNEMGSSTRPEIRENFSSTSRPSNMSSTTRARADQTMKLHIKQLADRLFAVIHRMDEIIVRIESRATKIDQNGGNTADARVDIATAKTEIEAAKSDLSTIQATAVSMLNAPNMAAVSASLSPIRTTIDSAHMHAQKAHEAIKSAVEKLVIAAEATRQNATTTPQI